MEHVDPNMCIGLKRVAQSEHESGRVQMPLNFLKFDPALAKDVAKYDVEHDDENQPDPDPRQSVA